MGIIRIQEADLNDPAVVEALENFFDSMVEVDHDKYRKTKDFRVIGDRVPHGDTICTVKIYYPDGIKPFVIEVE